MEKLPRALSVSFPFVNCCQPRSFHRGSQLGRSDDDLVYTCIEALWQKESWRAFKNGLPRCSVELQARRPRQTNMQIVLARTDRAGQIYRHWSSETPSREQHGQWSGSHECKVVRNEMTNCSHYTDMRRWVNDWVSLLSVKEPRCKGAQRFRPFDRIGST